MAESLNPTLSTRLLQAIRPDWTRTLLARRIVAGFLVLLAGVMAVRPNAADASVRVIVAERDISPGTAVGADDVALTGRPPVTVPDGAATDLGSVLGATLTGPVRRGEVITDVRVLSGRLAEAAAGPDARIVPVHPSDAALADLVRPGDVVDVVAADPAAGDDAVTTRVIASHGIVVLVSERQAGTADGRVVLVALPATAAAAVAGAGLVESVTLTLR